jgi:hypothetical protein
VGLDDIAVVVELDVGVVVVDGLDGVDDGVGELGAGI